MHNARGDREITAGCSADCRSGKAQRMPLLRGTHIHLWRFATYQSTPRSAMRNSIAPGACAPSPITATPFARSRALIAASGSTRALSAVM